MSKLLIQCSFLVIWFGLLDGEVYQDRPKIKTSDGDLILEPAFDKNIYLLPNGPKSNVFVGETNILEIKHDRNTKNQNGGSSDVDLEDFIKGTGILQRLDDLESKTSPLPEIYYHNISMLWRKINNINRKVTNLQVQLQNMGKDECESNPCQHGGTCLNLVEGYHCLCPSNWEGKDCDVDVNECRNFAGTDLGCQNMATCINRPGTYECLCRSGWFGLHCTRKAKDCTGGDFEMCGHGKCLPVPTGEGITCICHQGWTTNGTGVECSTDVNECESHQACSVNPRVECINLPGTFRCGACPPGYEGDGFSCSDIDECITVPNGGCNPMVTCQNTVGSRICGPCPSGYEGDGITCSWRGSCSINHGGCHPSAQCIENLQISGQGAQCVCPVGMNGNGIGLSGCYVSSDSNNSIVSCDNNPCGIHGQCHILRTGYTCICRRGYGGSHCDVPIAICASNPCLNGGFCKPDDNTERGFRCECTARYSGNLCQVLSRTCGGVLDAEEGNIIYPLSNTTYSHNAKCAWVIHTVPGKVINVTFSKFNLEEHSECLNDFLQIHDGRSSVNLLIGRFCGNSFPLGGNIVSSHNYLYLWFRSDATVSKNGFALHWTSSDPVCGGEMHATKHGHISSPGSPGKYPPNRDCYWHLTTYLGKRIQLHFFALDIETHPNCSFDYLAIYDGMRTTDPLLTKYCNSSQPAPIQSSGPEILIHFHSDAFGAGTGFQLAFAPAEGIPGCGGYFTGDKGEILSPSFNGSYLSNMLCEYKIKTSSDSRVRIDFKSFHLESSFKCKYDYLKVYDGPSSDSALVGKFCGNSFPKFYSASTNYLFLVFKSDYTIATGEGFKLSYEAICEISLVGDSGVIKSPSYPFDYPKNKRCKYIISTTPGKAIQLIFQDFDIEDNSHYNCQFDHVEIRDGADSNATLLGRYCGRMNHLPPVHTSTHNYMYVTFESDMSVSGTGFYANYTTIDTKCGGIYRSNPGLISHPSGETNKYENDQSCTWIIIAPEGMHIKLSWNRFEVENMPGCESDYLELIEQDDNNTENNFGKFCGTKTPPALTSSTNRLTLKFNSDSSVRLGGFSVSYTFIDEKSHCGGVYYKSHGFIYSPGWPSRYQTNRDCTWTITVPVGQQIRLNISNFDLERPIHGKCRSGDYLEIRNGLSEFSPLINQYCGAFNTKVIVSLSNVLNIHFHSDFYLTGNGFKIEWDGSIMGCGGTLTSSTGSISSPNYPESYNENSECSYRIVTSLGSRIKIGFTDLDLERTTDCKDDYVEIFDGQDPTAPSLGKYCYMSAGLNNIETSTNYAFIKFRSDFYIAGKGFLLNYYTMCNNNVTGIYGVIESPDFPSSYPTSLNCLWNINVPIGNKIKVVFSHFDIFKNTYFRRWSQTACNLDFLQWREPSESTYSSKFCGDKLPPMILTKKNSLQIKFSTGFYSSKTGFRLEWVNEGCGGHIQKSYGFVSVNASVTSSGEIECEWLVETSIGKSINLYIAGFYLSTTQNCTTDAIEIYNGQNINSPQLMKICNRDFTGHVQSTSNFMFIRFVKHSMLRGTYLTTSYTSSKATCGGRIEAVSGFIYSKNYPKNYDNNLDCTWMINVPNNHRIELNLIDFDLNSYRSADFDTFTDNDDVCGDSIKIYDSESLLSTNYTQIICPTSKISQIITKYHRIMIQFTTDNYGSAKGFKMSFRATCGARISALSDGIISSDKNIVGTNRSCTWTIIGANLDQQISLTFTHLSLPKDNFNSVLVSNTSCSSTYLRVFDGDDDQAPQINEFCGQKAPPMIVSHGNAITVVLGSHNNDIVGRFSAHYSPLSTACGGTFTSEEGTVASPNYPHSYPKGADCEWILSTSPGNRVYITFERFSLEYSDVCNEDYLEIRENSGAGKLLGVYCGNDIPVNTTAATKLYIKFHSNDKTTGTDSFLLHYGFLHGNDFIGLEKGEISSPLYPHPYLGSGEYTWRVLTDKDMITVTIDRLEIHSYSEICINKLSIFDGYDDTAPLLDELCGILPSKLKILETTSNVVFIKLTLDESKTGALFHLRWNKMDKNPLDDNDKDKINCGSKNISMILPGHRVAIQSPNYPKEYDNDLNCEWIYESITGRHLGVRFLDFELEEIGQCVADSVSVYSSNNLIEWKPIKETQCSSESMANTDIDTSRYMKIRLKTDNSVKKKGFRGYVQSKCGGYFTQLSGEIDLSMDDVTDTFRMEPIKCNWTIKVRPGRVMKLKFLIFNITNTETKCVSSVSLHNGDSIDSPFLASGKYCGYSHENKSDITSSGNSVFLNYVNYFPPRFSGAFQTFKLFYEEVNVDCGLTSKLDSGHPWEIITSLNYPLPPIPYSECIWKFSSPPGEILRVDFIERFDLDYIDECGTEVVELRDGASSISPVIGRYCGEKPATKKTSSNMLYIKYSTQLSEPRNGFKANISIDVCGGTIISANGEIISPGYPHMNFMQAYTTCIWTLKGSPRLVYQITPMDIDLPESETPCATKVSILEKNNVNNSYTVLRTFCNNGIDPNMEPIQTSNYEILLKFEIGKPSEWHEVARMRGFRFTFNSSMPSCGGTVKASEGYLLTPNYPLETTIRYCQWYIEVPDKTRRITLEMIDVQPEKSSFSVYNDNGFKSRINSSLDNGSIRIFESSGNVLSLFIWMNKMSSRHKFKAKFSSNLRSLCGAKLTGLNGELIFPDLHRSFSCDWNYNIENNLNVNNDYKYSTLLLTLKLNSSATRCMFANPKLTIKSTVYRGMLFSHDYCSNVETSLLIPSTQFQLKALKNDGGSLDFNLKWDAQPCGGPIHVSDEAINILNIPKNYNTTLDCAWTVVVDSFSRVELKMEGAFQLNCYDEFIKISNGISRRLPVIGEYCKSKTLDNSLSTNYRYMTVQYHSKAPNITNIRLIAKLTNGQCGGALGKYESFFASPNYPKNYDFNQECTWFITAGLGYRVSLQFIDRFVIEDRPNCTKDAVIIYDWKDNNFNEIARLCGRQIPKPFNSTYNKMKVVLRTDNTTNMDGFRASWKPVCGGNFTATNKEQFLYSPGYPQEYDPMLNCLYNIVAPNQESLIIQFQEFELERTYPECMFDNLTITSESNYDSYQTINCENKMPSTITSYNKVSISFKTDKYVQRKGFKLSYMIYKCGGHVKNQTLLTSHPSDFYDANMNCTWHIEAPTNKIVVLKFLYIDLENYECNNDYIAVFDGLLIDDNKRLALLCGHDNSSTVLRSHGNKLLLQFVTDQSANYNGFKVEVIFSYAESVGCGGQVDLTTSAVKTLKSFLLENSIQYESYLDCYWTIISPADTIIKMEFNKFHIAPCRNVNQTELGYSKCDCDFVEIKDGVNPNSLTIGTFCGHTAPPILYSSANLISIRLSTDGEIESSGFEVKLSVQSSLCGKSIYKITDNIQHIKSPDYEKGIVPRAIHCIYYLNPGDRHNDIIRISFITFDLQVATTHIDSNKCDKDKLEIVSHPIPRNMTLGKDYVMSYSDDMFLNNGYYYEEMLPHRVQICGNTKPSDIYVTGSAAITLITASESDSHQYKGFDIEVSFAGFCGRNYTDTQGKIQSPYMDSEDDNRRTDSCYTLITAPENHTISAYFVSVSPHFWNENCFLDIYDGKDTYSSKLVSIKKGIGEVYAVFSTGRYMLLHSQRDDNDRVFYDLNYVTTDKGRGCGGKLTNELGKLTSPMYPENYRRKSTCEWELETPVGTRLKLKFSEFDLGLICDQNYLQLIDSKGNVISSYCSERPADYTSNDNFVKIVFITSVNNSGKGWVAEFIGIV